MLKALVFDFDGIIADSEPLHYRAILETLKPLKIHFDYDEYKRTYIGYDDRDLFRTVRDEFDLSLDAQQLDQLIADKAEAFEALARQGVEPFPGVVELIVSASKVVPVAICSGAIRNDIDVIMAGIEGGSLLERLTTIVTADDVQRSKPDPECYLLAASRLKLSPQQCLAIEDTPTGLASAKAAGMRTLAVANSYRVDELHIAERAVESLAGLDLDQLHAWYSDSTTMPQS